jgi:hypothetical protein
MLKFLACEPITFRSDVLERLTKQGQPASSFDLLVRINAPQFVMLDPAAKTVADELAESKLELDAGILLDLFLY